jgi:hypothetical protein
MIAYLLWMLYGAELDDSLPLMDVIWDMSYPVCMSKSSTHRMHDPGLIIPHIRPNMFIDNQKSRIKCNYYINKVSKDYDDPQAERNSGRLHNTTGMTIGATRSLELLIEELQSIFSF